MGWHGPRGACGCCCTECDTMDDTWRWRLCPETYVDDPDLSGAENDSNESGQATGWANIDTHLSGASGGGAMIYYGPYDRSGTDYEGYQATIDFMDLGAGATWTASTKVWVTEDCNPFMGAESATLSWDEFHLVFGCEWPVGDACHPRWYWGIVGKFSGSERFWVAFSEDLGDGPVPVDISVGHFKPPVLPAAPSTNCPMPTASLWSCYLVTFLYTFTAAAGYCCRNPLTAAPYLNTTTEESEIAVTECV